MTILYQETIPPVPLQPNYLIGFALIVIGAVILFNDRDDHFLRFQACIIVLLGLIYGGAALLGNNSSDGTERLYIDISAANPYEEAQKWEAAGWELSERKGKLYILEREVGKE